MCLVEQQLMVRLKPVSRGFGFAIHGVASNQQPQESYASVSKRMPVEMWEFEDLCQALEGKPREPYTLSRFTIRRCLCASLPEQEENRAEYRLTASLYFSVGASQNAVQKYA